MLKRMRIDTHQEPIVYMQADCHVCRAEGFSAADIVNAAEPYRLFAGQALTGISRNSDRIRLSNGSLA